MWSGLGVAKYVRKYMLIAVGDLHGQWQGYWGWRKWCWYLKSIQSISLCCKAGHSDSTEYYLCVGNHTWAGWPEACAYSKGSDVAVLLAECPEVEW